MTDGTTTRSCSTCGRMERCPEEGMPPGWSFEFEGRRLTYTCDGCLRANITAIEGRLPQEYWEF